MNRKIFKENTFQAVMIRCTNTGWSLGRQHLWGLEYVLRKTHVCSVTVLGKKANILGVYELHRGLQDMRNPFTRLESSEEQEMLSLEKRQLMVSMVTVPRLYKPSYTEGTKLCWRRRTARRCSPP